METLSPSPLTLSPTMLRLASVAHAAQFSDLVRGKIQLEQAHHLAIAVLFNNVHALMLRHKLMHLARKRIRAQADVVGLEIELAGKLVTAFPHREISGAVGDDTD